MDGGGSREEGWDRQVQLGSRGGVHKDGLEFLQTWGAGGMEWKQRDVERKMNKR